jgi:hypothetical protein
MTTKTVEEIETVKKPRATRTSKKEEPKHLSDEDKTKMELLLERMKNNQERLRLVQMDEKIRQLEVEKMKLQSEIVQLKIQLKEVELAANSPVQQAKSQLAEMLEHSQKAKDAYVEEIREKYGITDPEFGFNPATGELIATPVEDSSS